LRSSQVVFMVPWQVCRCHRVAIYDSNSNVSYPIRNLNPAVCSRVADQILHEVEPNEPCAYRS
jgi:hypothetical protein